MWFFCQTVKCIKRKERCKRFFLHKYVFLNTAGERQSTSRVNMYMYIYLINLTYSVKKLDCLIPNYSCNWILSHRPLHKNILPMNTSFLYQPPVDQCWFVAWSMLLHAVTLLSQRSIVSVSMKTAFGIHCLEYIISMYTI